MFTPAGQMRPFDVQVREYKVMNMLRHGNIVKLLAIEEEVNTTCILLSHLNRIYPQIDIYKQSVSNIE